MKSCQSLGNNRITDQNNSASAADLKFPAEPQGKKTTVSFQSILELSHFVIAYLFSFQKRPRKYAHGLVVIERKIFFFASCKRNSSMK